MDTDIDVRAWRQRPDKFTMIMNSPALGETREIYNGGNFYLQTDFGMDTHLNLGSELNRMQLFSAIFDVLDPAFFTSFTFEGSFDMEGRKVNAITAKPIKVQLMELLLTKRQNCLSVIRLRGRLLRLEIIERSATLCSRSRSTSIR